VLTVAGPLIVAVSWGLYTMFVVLILLSECPSEALAIAFTVTVSLVLQYRLENVLPVPWLVVSFPKYQL
jgi:hypothetical protein